MSEGWLFRLAHPVVACAGAGGFSNSTIAPIPPPMSPPASLLPVTVLVLCALGCGRAPSPSPSSSVSATSVALSAAPGAACGAEAPQVEAPQVEACALPGAPVSAQRDDKSLTGAPLAVCSSAPLTGWFRDGKCSAGADDTGVHVVCAKLTEEFLSFTKSKGNDLVTPRGAFPGLVAGQQWCLCASRWDEAARAGVAPPVVLDATHESATRVAGASSLKAHALGRP